MVGWPEFSVHFLLGIATSALAIRFRSLCASFALHAGLTWCGLRGLRYGLIPLADNAENPYLASVR
jgi:hypothetical protein